MDDHAIVERLRADADQLDDGVTNVDALVDRALVGGRRRRTRRRVAGALTGVVAAGFVVAAVASGVSASLHSGQSVIPAAPPPQGSVTQTQVPPPATGTRATTGATTKARVPTQRVTGSPADVRRTFIKALGELLPNDATVSHGSAAREIGSDGFPWENNATVTVRDKRGSTYFFGGIGNGTYEDGCFHTSPCTKTSLPNGGTVWSTGGPSSDKSGIDLQLYYNRPQGGHVWLTERNFASGSGPVTRDKLRLTKTSGRELVTDASWDQLFDH